MKGFKVCHVCSAHPADDVRVFHRDCVSLAAAGYEVHLIAAGPGDGGGAPYIERGVTIHPLPPARSRRARLARRSQVAKLAASLAPDLFHVHEPELLGPTISRAGSRPVIWDVHESYLDVLGAREWIPAFLRPLARGAWGRRERQLLRRCAGVVVVTERIGQRYRQLHSRVEIVSNFPQLEGWDTLPQPARDGRTCVFAGALKPDRGLLQVLAALALLRGRGEDVLLLLAGKPYPGDFVETLFSEAERLGVRDLVEYRGVVSQQEAIALQNSASIGLVPYLPVSNTMLSLANKLVEGMALGLPLVFSNFPNYYEIAGESGAGIAVDPTKPEEIAAALERLLCEPDLARRMSEAGRRAARERFNWNVENAKLLRLYAAILAPGEVSTSPS